MDNEELFHNAFCYTTLDNISPLEKACKETFPNFLSFYDEDLFKNERNAFVHGSKYLKDQITSFQESIKKISLISLIFFWENQLKENSLHEDFNSQIMAELIEQKLFKIVNDNRPLLLAEVSKQTHCETVNAIRCYLEWPILKKEEAVDLYLSFSNWLTRVTFGCLPLAEDMDRIVSVRRRLTYDLYVQFLKKLSCRDGLLVKLFYLGGERNLEEVLDIKIQDIDFQNRKISFQKSSVKYSDHVFQDIKHEIKDRKSGYVFLSRNGERLNYVVPYRNLKPVAIQLGLDPSFTFKDLARDI